MLFQISITWNPDALLNLSNLSFKHKDNQKKKKTFRSLKQWSLVTSSLWQYGWCNLTPGQLCFLSHSDHLNLSFTDDIRPGANQSAITLSCCVSKALQWTMPVCADPLSPLTSLTYFISDPIFHSVSIHSPETSLKKKVCLSSILQDLL